MDNYYDKIRERVLNPKTSLDDINVSQNFNSPPLSPPLSVSGLPAPPSARANDRKIVLVLVQWLGPSLGSFEVKAIDDLLKLKGVGRERSTIAYLPIYCDIPQHLTPNQLKLPGVGSKAHQTSPLLIRHLAQIGRNDITIDYFWKFGDWVCAQCGLTNWAERNTCKNGPKCLTRGGPRPPTRVETMKALCFNEIQTAMSLKMPIFVVSGESCWDKSSGRAPKPPSKSVAHVHDTNAKAIAAASLQQYPDLKINLSVSPTKSPPQIPGSSQQKVATSNVNSKGSARSYAQIAGNGNDDRARSYLPMNTYERGLSDQLESLELDKDAEYYEIEKRSSNIPPNWSTGWNQSYMDNGAQQQQQQQQQQQWQPNQLSQPQQKKKPKPDESSQATGNNSSSGPSDFVRKLFMMLEDSQYNSVVSWSPSGETFVVKEMNDFTKLILPRHFKHSNFASFVRQLNKYDFHKVKREEGEEKPWGDQTWEFKHPEFKANCRHLLENIKRKAPTGKGKPTVQQQTTNAAQELQNQSTFHEIANIQQQIENLNRNQQETNLQFDNLQSNYLEVVNGIMSFQRNLINQDQQIQNILQHLIEQDMKTNNYVDNDKVNRLIGKYKEAASSTFSQMGDLNRKISSYNQRKRVSTPVATPPAQPPPQSQPQPQIVHGPHPQTASQPSAQGLKVFTFGQLRQRDGDNNAYMAQGAPQVSNLGASTSTVKTEPEDPPTTLQKPQAHWTVPPRVLLVEDDAVCRKLSSKFLQIFGCTIDVADDGVSAVNKMNFTKYDLVLMDIVMPNLDGVAATNLIRQFDPMTPIISMTSNSNPNDILNYFSHGMNDILPKPFTKEGLFGMVEKHLLHLKTMQQLCEVPRALGLPPLKDQSISEALQSTAQAVIPNQSSGSSSSSDSKNTVWQQDQQAQSTAPTSVPNGQELNYNPATLAAQAMTSDDGETVNPLASMGMSDENYVNMLQGILASGAMDNNSNYQGRASPVAIATAAAKRAIDDDSIDSQYKKKTRFEELID
ncbi:response regulator [Wallemia mellicola]|uniref:Response regulator n=1 Tax=Wallemia mellicola TaxID=1708541 RepID=A0A4V4MV06_9BASI|nr:hypothetical protein E3Q23_01697 [Wallemia mellicola]TIC00380.1 response regulator [Wallemia mellicola]TIC13723.1 response regulator [Wallemia mellicola]TIC32003.1 response regulator [Wallemia mellicola]TIC41252.1 response regulator [Wallemia mellicola]